MAYKLAVRDKTLWVRRTIEFDRPLIGSSANHPLFRNLVLRRNQFQRYTLLLAPVSIFSRALEESSCLIRKPQVARSIRVAGSNFSAISLYRGNVKHPMIRQD